MWFRCQLCLQILQVTLALAVAESCLEFEHRDLHWGNLLIQTVPESTSQVYRLRGHDWNVRSTGIKVCLIDFTLSRLIGPHGTGMCSDLAKEDIAWLFSQIEGKEDVSPQVCTPALLTLHPRCAGLFTFLLCPQSK